MKIGDHKKNNNNNILYFWKFYNYNVLSINVIMSCFFKFTYIFIADTDFRAVVWLGCGLVGLYFSLHAMLLNYFSFKLIFYGQ